jgi:tRNA (Thr-GGU) A37 N-methylase
MVTRTLACDRSPNGAAQAARRDPSTERAARVIRQERSLTSRCQRPNIPLIGVFRTRSPDRPNPIGVHRVTVSAREDPTHLRVGALEAIDGTPILDLKIAMRESPEA